MTTDAAPDIESIEEENNALRKSQVDRINSSIRKVRSISRQSIRAVGAAEAKSADENPGFYVESPGTIERIGSGEDTGRFCIPEPTPKEKVSAALTEAIESLEKERRAFHASSSSPVVKSWKLL